MAIAVETFEVPEVSYDGEPECEQEALELIESLGLRGQQALINKSGKRCPYREMTLEEQWVYSHLCPRRTALNEYRDGPIPLRVMQVAAHAREHFARLYVLHPRSAMEKDPVLIGETTVNTWDEGHKVYILARWGDLLEPFEVLMEKAAVRFKAEIVAAYDVISKKASAMCEAMATASPLSLIGKQIPVFHD